MSDAQGRAEHLTPDRKRPPSLSPEERLRRRPLPVTERVIGVVDVERPWLHDLYEDDLLYRWLVKNRLMREDRHGIELSYRARSRDDVICGARTIRPGIAGFKGFSWRMDQSVDHEVVCSVAVDHGEIPHIGVPADCADMTCRCAAYGCHHLVIEGFARKPQAQQVDGSEP